jgi:hypothetical protein
MQDRATQSPLTESCLLCRRARGPALTNFRSPIGLAAIPADPPRAATIAISFAATQAIASLGLARIRWSSLKMPTSALRAADAIRRPIWCLQSQPP